jgi:hypothetical protein
LDETNSPPAEKILSIFTESVTMMDLLLLFRENPNLVDTEDGIASRIGLTGKKISEKLAKLVAINLLSITKVGDKTFYQWNRKRDQELQAIVVGDLRLTNRK